MKKLKLHPTHTSVHHPLNVPSKELQSITKIILHNIKAEKIICFASNIRTATSSNCFTTEDPVINPTQLNTYCLLLVPAANEKLPDLIIQQQIENAVKEIAIITIIVHRMNEINQALQNGSSFFTAIYKKGTMLHDNQEEIFNTQATVSNLSKSLIRKEKLWNQWAELSDGFLHGAKFYLFNQKNNLAIFMLHQSLQHCYAAILRVFTGYRINSNSLRRLLKLIDATVPGYSFSGTKHTPEEARLTAILLKGYNDARYNEKFEVSKEEVIMLINRIENILESANAACTAHLESLKTHKPSAAQN